MTEKTNVESIVETLTKLGVTATLTKSRLEMLKALTLPICFEDAEPRTQS